jgi:long-subunit acyl-CoA synthetase (AMP-forming)
VSIPTTTPAGVKLSATVCQAFQDTVSARRGESAVRTRGGEIDWSWEEYARRVREAAAALAGLGLQRGDTMAVWLGNRPEFHIADAAAMHLGAASFSVYPTYTAEQAGHVIADAGARMLVTEPAFLDQALSVRESGRTPLETIALVEGAHASAMDWGELLACAQDDFDFDAAVAAVEPDDLITLIYTSGTTGPPKGVHLTHGNVIAQLGALKAMLDLPDGARAISWLPMAHIAERMCTHYFPIAFGWAVTACEDPRAIADLLPEVRPVFFFSPPRLWEKLRAGVLAAADDDAKAAIDQALERVRAGEGPQDGPVQQAIRARVGFDEIRAAVVGAAPCPPEVIEFWHAVGVPLGELYGMSETTGVATVNPPDAVHIGTVGVPVPGIEVKLSDAGEVLMRGPVVMRGYRNLPDKTAEAIDPDGWMHSGDVGQFDEDGYLRIVDRIKELIINAAGKNMSPANIEAALKTGSDLIGQACCIGDARPYNVALITLDPDAAAAFAARHGIHPAPESLVGDERVQEEVAAGVQRANQRLARVEQIKKFTVLPVEWLPDSDELTPTMKLKRKPISEKYAAEIEQMYGG